MKTIAFRTNDIDLKNIDTIKERLEIMERPEHKFKTLQAGRYNQYGIGNKQIIGVALEIAAKHLANEIQKNLFNDKYWEDQK